MCQRTTAMGPTLPHGTSQRCEAQHAMQLDRHTGTSRPLDLQALRKAGCHTDDINVADAVYV